ncbi:MAG TPA: hypothetical protein VGI98_02925 [Candidatus Limnocylindrales bacterium]|jgi:hypothetical protein
MDRNADSGSPSTRLFLVERYWPGIDEPGARAVVSSMEATARTMQAEGTAVEHVGSILMPADQVVFSLVTAADEAAVRALNARADAPVDRIAAAIGIGIGLGLSKGDT